MNNVFTARGWKARSRFGHTESVMPRRYRFLIFVLLALNGLGAQAAPHLYRFDRVHSQILFGVGHDGFSNALGMLHIAAGWLRFDAQDWSNSSAELDIDLAGVDMGNADWNRTVRGTSLLDAKGHPYAHFVSTAVKRTGKDEGVLEGRLTLRNITRPVHIAFRLNRNAPTIFAMGRTVAGFTASAQLDRTAFGITRNPNSIGQTVTVRLEIEAQRDADAHRAYQQWRSNHATAQ